MIYLIAALAAFAVLGGVYCYAQSSSSRGPVALASINGALPKKDWTTKIELHNMQLYELTPLGEGNKASFTLRAMGHKTPAADGSSPKGNNALASLKIEYRAKSIETVINEGSSFTLETMSGKVEQLGSDGESATLVLSFLHEDKNTGS